MIDQLTIEASLADKPSFRWVLEEQEKDIIDLETILDKVCFYKTKLFCAKSVSLTCITPYVDSHLLGKTNCIIT